MAAGTMATRRRRRRKLSLAGRVFYGFVTLAFLLVLGCAGIV
jgi:hypothetical protein